MYLSKVKISALKRYDHILSELFNIRIFVTCYDNKCIDVSILDYNTLSKSLNKYKDIVLLSINSCYTVRKYITFQKFHNELSIIYYLNKNKCL